MDSFISGRGQRKDKLRSKRRSRMNEESESDKRLSVGAMLESSDEDEDAESIQERQSRQSKRLRKSREMNQKKHEERMEMNRQSMRQ